VLKTVVSVALAEPCDRADFPQSIIYS